MNIKACAIAALAIATSVPLNATVFTVTSPADSGPGSLRDQVAASSPGDTIQFAITGPILLHSAITIPNTLYVMGPGPSSLIIDAGHFDRAFVASGSPVFISGMTIVNGLAAGADGPDAPFPGQNGAPGMDAMGGAIMSSGSLIVSNCWITGNTAQGGHGGKGGDNPPSSAFTPGNGGNGGQGLGGAIYADGGGSPVTIVYCTFSNNRAIGGNGGAGGTNGAFVPLTGGTGGAGGTANGGAVDEFSGVFAFTNVTFSGNIATSGAGGAGGNTVAGTGGNGGNSSAGTAGAVATFYAAFFSDTIVSNSAISGIAGAGGNGFPPGSAGTAAQALGGGVTGYTLFCISTNGNTIIADNFSSGSYSNFDIGIADVGNNFFGTEDYNLCSIGPGTQVGIGSSLHPQLGPLAQNGSGMPTHAVPLTSPVLDAGYSFGLTNDERGATRPYDFPTVPNGPDSDGSDIGAFELGSPDLGAAVSGNTVVISWPAAYGDFVLQSSSNLQTPGSWTVVATNPIVVSNQFVVANPMTNGFMFYRLLNQPATP